VHDSSIAGLASRATDASSVLCNCGFPEGSVRWDRVANQYFDAPRSHNQTELDGRDRGLDDCISVAGSVLDSGGPWTMPEDVDLNNVDSMRMSPQSQHEQWAANASILMDTKPGSKELWLLLFDWNPQMIQFNSTMKVIHSIPVQVQIGSHHWKLPRFELDWSKHTHRRQGTCQCHAGFMKVSGFNWQISDVWGCILQVRNCTQHESALFQRMDVTSELESARSTRKGLVQHPSRALDANLRSNKFLFASSQNYWWEMTAICSNSCEKTAQVE